MLGVNGLNEARSKGGYQCRVGVFVKKPIWITLGLDPIKEVVVILGFARSEAEAKEHKKRADTEAAEVGCDDVIYRKSFRLCGDRVGHELSDWLGKCGIARNDRIGIIREIGTSMLEMIERK